VAEPWQVPDFLDTVKVDRCPGGVILGADVPQSIVRFARALGDTGPLVCRELAYGHCDCCHSDESTRRSILLVSLGAKRCCAQRNVSVSDKVPDHWQTVYTDAIGEPIARIVDDARRKPSP